jgi:uncharacterized membrane protein
VTGAAHWAPAPRRRLRERCLLATRTASAECVISTWAGCLEDGVREATASGGRAVRWRRERALGHRWAVPHIENLHERIRQSLWFIPGIFATVAVVAAFVLLEVDRQMDADGGFFFFGGTPSGAREVLSTIATSMLTFTGLVFTITMLVLQLASSQLSPRVMRTFLRDRANQVVLGLFIATFLFTLVVLREVRGEDADEFVPGLSIWIAFALLVASVAAFIYYINHMAQAIRASTVIHNIGNETREAIRRLFPEEIGAEPEEPDTRRLPERDLPSPDRLVTADHQGALVEIDDDELLSAAAGHDLLVELVPTIGDYVPEGAPLFRVWGGPRKATNGADGSRDGRGDREDDGQRREGEAKDDRWEALEGQLRQTVGLASERTLRQDPAFGFRQLVDIAVRALSAGINDPTTAVQALDQVHDLLRRLARREFPAPVRLDEDGRPRLILHRPEWDDYVRLGIDEIRLYGSDAIQVVRRLREILEDLTTVAPLARQRVLAHELELLDDAIEREFDHPSDRRTARLPSTQGHGSDT